MQGTCGPGTVGSKHQRRIIGIILAITPITALRGIITPSTAKSWSATGRV